MLIFLPSTYLHIRTNFCSGGTHRDKLGTIEFRSVGTMRIVGKKEHLKLKNGVKGVRYCDTGGGVRTAPIQDT